MYIHMVSTKNIFKAIWMSSVIVFTEDFGYEAFHAFHEKTICRCHLTRYGLQAKRKNRTIE